MLAPSENGYRIGVIDPLTLVGREVRSLLRERGVPFSHLALLDSTDKDSVTLTADDEEAAVVTPLTVEALSDLDIVFFCGQPESTMIWSEIENNTLLSIDLTQPSSISSDGALIVAGVNHEEINDSTSLVISPHPAAIPIILILDALRRGHEITLAIGTIIQPASELGQEGVDELLEQTINVLNVMSVPRKIFPQQLAFNLFPSVEADRLEAYLAAQARAVIDRDLQVSLSLTQGTVFHSHTFALYVRLDGEPFEDEIAEILGKSEAIEVADVDAHLSTIDAGGRDEVLVSRISRDESTGGFWIWAVADNLRRSSSLNAVLILEYVIARFGQPVN